MAKKLVVVLILSGMAMHCAGRIGFLSYLYQQRHEIAYQLGIINEIPIAMCSHEYDGRSGLTVVHATDETPGTIPPGITQAKEINLFLSHSSDLVNPERTLIPVIPSPAINDPPYASPALSIFHPPCC